MHVKSSHEDGGGAAAVVEVERVAEGVVVEAEPAPAPPARPRQVQPPDAGAQPPVQAPHQVPAARAVAARRRGADDSGLYSHHHRSHSVAEEIAERRDSGDKRCARPELSFASLNYFFLVPQAWFVSSLDCGAGKVPCGRWNI
jgi:hypothetical protein